MLYIRASGAVLSLFLFFYHHVCKECSSKRLNLVLHSTMYSILLKKNEMILLKFSFHLPFRLPLHLPLPLHTLVLLSFSSYDISFIFHFTLFFLHREIRIGLVVIHGRTVGRFTGSTGNGREDKGS